MKKAELFLEEAVLDDLASGMNALEVPVSRRVFYLLFLFVFLAGLIVVGRILALGWWGGTLYGARAFLNANAITILPSERGLITDRFGKALAQNEPSFDLILTLGKFLKAYPDPREPFRALEEAMGVEPGTFETILEEADALRGDSLILLPRLTIPQVLKIKELHLEGVDAQNSFQRSYDKGEAFAHLLGYTGIVSKGDLKKDETLTARDLIGKAGIEAEYDQELRGTRGEIIQHRDAHGNPIGEITTKKAETGKTLETTVDKDLQIYFYNRLKAQLAEVGSPAGAGIAINPQNGEVLSLVSLPSFNNQQIDPEHLKNPNQPFFNRAISGLYSPGSTIKPLVATAVLNEGVLKTTDKIFSRGYIEVPNPYNPEEPSRFVDWKPHGWVDVYSALARSSNIFFYAAGGGLPSNEREIFNGSIFPKGLGIKKLNGYWQKFGLGNKTGIDIPGEVAGSLPSVEAKEKQGGVWRLGDTYNISIGQGDLLITPLELVNYIAAIGNGGKLYEPHFLKKIVDAQGIAVKEGKTNVLADLSGELGRWIIEVQRGMRDGVRQEYGTSFTLSDLPFSVAAKTGSSQTQNNQKVNALFAGYAPADSGKPEIAILVLIEEAREGSLNAVPVAKDVLRWYYINRMQNVNIKVRN